MRYMVSCFCPAGVILLSCCGPAVVLLWSCCGPAVILLVSCCGPAVCYCVCCYQELKLAKAFDNDKVLLSATVSVATRN